MINFLRKTYANGGIVTFVPLFAGNFINEALFVIKEETNRPTVYGKNSPLSILGQALFDVYLIVGFAPLCGLKA